MQGHLQRLSHGMCPLVSCHSVAHGPRSGNEAMCTIEHESNEQRLQGLLSQARAGDRHAEQHLCDLARSIALGAAHRQLDYDIRHLADDAAQDAVWEFVAGYVRGERKHDPVRSIPALIRTRTSLRARDYVRTHVSRRLPLRDPALQARAHPTGSAHEPLVTMVTNETLDWLTEHVTAYCNSTHDVDRRWVMCFAHAHGRLYCEGDQQRWQIGDTAHPTLQALASALGYRSASSVYEHVLKVLITARLFRGVMGEYPARYVESHDATHVRTFAIWAGEWDRNGSWRMRQLPRLISEVAEKSGVAPGTASARLAQSINDLRECAMA